MLVWCWAVQGVLKKVCYEIDDIGQVTKETLAVLGSLRAFACVPVCVAGAELGGLWCVYYLG